MLVGKQTELAFVTAARRRERHARRAARVRWAEHARRGAPHVARPSHDARHPVHATLRLLPHATGLRRWKTARALRRCFVAGCDRFGFRLVQFAVMGNHLHLVAEAQDKAALRRGMQGLSIRVAKALNRLQGQKGKVLADRYYARALETAAETRAVLNYVMTNARKHGLAGAGDGAGGTDRFSSAMYFDGWVPPVQAVMNACRAAQSRASPDEAPPVAPARTWLVQVGWRRLGNVDPRRPARSPEA